MGFINPLNLHRLFAEIALGRLGAILTNLAVKMVSLLEDGECYVFSSC